LYYYVLKEQTIYKEAPMGANIVHSIKNSPQAIIKNLRSQDKLPFQDVLSAEILEKHLSKVGQRDRIFTPELTLFGFLSQAIGENHPCQASVSQVIVHHINQGIEQPSANTAAYCKARSRFPEAVLSELTRESGQQLETEVDPKWMWHGRHVKLMDGSTVSMADTPENQEVYPQANTQKKGSAFP
jgi:hypothetical protein